METPVAVIEGQSPSVKQTVDEREATQALSRIVCGLTLDNSDLAIPSASFTENEFDLLFTRANMDVSRSAKENKATIDEFSGYCYDLIKCTTRDQLARYMHKFGLTNEIDRKYWYELNRNLAYIGKVISIFWPHEGEWYRGKITNYDMRIDQHLIYYFATKEYLFEKIRGPNRKEWK